MSLTIDKQINLRKRKAFTLNNMNIPKRQRMMEEHLLLPTEDDLSPLKLDATDMTSNKKAGRQTVKTRRVNFGKVTVREYQRALGDNPSCSTGVPISISNVYNSIHKEVTVDEYEVQHRVKGIHDKEGCSRLDEGERQYMLFMNGFTFEQMKEATKESKKIQQQRFETIVLLKKQSEEKKRLFKLLAKLITEMK